MKRPRVTGDWQSTLTGMLAVVLASGCATPPAPRRAEPAFYPPPPAPPRLQFLTSYSSEADLGRRPGRWYDFIVGRAETEPVELAKPYGVCIRSNRIYACDTVGRSIAIFDLAAGSMSRWTPAGEGRLHSPINLAFDRDDVMYIADSARGNVPMFDARTNYLGSLAELDGMKPADVAVSAERIYVADLLHHRVAVYDRRSRQRLFTIPAGPEDGASRLFSPTNLALDSAGRLYVSDTGAFRVQQYDAAGRHLRSFGLHGDGPGQFARPKGIALDRERRLYAVDAAMQVVQIFDGEGNLLLHFGGPEAGGPSLSLPADVAIDYDHVDRFRAFAAPGFALEYLVLISSQYGDHKINVYGFGHRP